MFNGSIVLEQLAEGHCTTTYNSLCTTNIFRRYWQTGELPEKGTKCEVEEKPSALEARDAERIGGMNGAGEERIGRGLIW